MLGQSRRKIHLDPNGTYLSAEIQDKKADSALLRNRVFIRMVFIRIKTRLARGSAAKMSHNPLKVPFI